MRVAFSQDWAARAEALLLRALGSGEALKFHGRVFREDGTLRLDSGVEHLHELFDRGDTIPVRDDYAVGAS